MSMETMNFASLFESSNFGSNTSNIIKARVLNITNKYIELDASLKSESKLPISEFKDKEGNLTVNVGDEIDVAVEHIEDGTGETIISYEKAKRIVAWRSLEDAMENDTTLSGITYGRVKGGIGVLYNNIKLFLPGSLVDVRAVRDFQLYENKEISFKVIKIDKRRNNIVVSRKAVLMEENGHTEEDIISNLKEGEQVTGIVKNITDYGVFIDLGGIDGLIYITDISWKRIKHPSDVVSLGQDIVAVVLKIDLEKRRVSLGLKQLQEDPWINIAEKHPVNSRIKGKISNITEYGAFIAIDECVEGLVHLSEMDWTNKNINPHKILHIGDEIEVLVLEVNEARRRISLGIKQCQDNPWKIFAETHKKGDCIQGIVRSITQFGIFVGLEGGIDGLVHISDMSWNDNDSILSQYKKGQEVEIVVLSIDVAKERISLGIKQLYDDPFTNYILHHQKNSVVNATVLSFQEQEVVLQLAENVTAVLTKNEMAELSNHEIHEEEYAVGKVIQVLITNINKKTRVIYVSTKGIQERDTNMKIREIRHEGESAGNTSLGELLNESFSVEN